MVKKLLTLAVVLISMAAMAGVAAAEHGSGAGGIGLYESASQRPTR